MIKWLIIIPAALVAIIIGVSFYLQPNDFIGCGDRPVEGTECQVVDAITVVSGGDTFARTEEGIKLYENGWADALVFSGAAYDESSPSNAAAMRRYAIEAGVPASAIYVDEDARTTQQNAENSQTIFDRYNFEKVMLVTSGYHQRRSMLEFEKSAGDTVILNHPLMSDKDWSIWWWLSPRGWWLATGELAKIIAFYVQDSTQ